MSGDDLSPGSTGLTAKEVLLEVRSDVKQIGRDVTDLSQTVTVLTSQNLDQRLNAIESWQDRMNGRVNGLIVLVSVLGGIIATLLGIVTLLRVVFPPI